MIPSRHSAIAPLTAGTSLEAAAHVHDPRLIDLVCTTAEATPGLVLVPFLALAAIGAWRAIVRHRRDR